MCKYTLLARKGYHQFYASVRAVYCEALLMSISLIPDNLFL
jgi:hypothetical protein